MDAKTPATHKQLSHSPLAFQMLPRVTLAEYILFQFSTNIAEEHTQSTFDSKHQLHLMLNEALIISASVCT